MVLTSSKVQTDVCIIGSGIVGLFTALGLSRLGLSCVLVEQQFPGAGSSLHCGGILHSGVRYAVSDPNLARLCFEASQVIQKDYPFAVDTSRQAYYVGFLPSHFDYSQRLLEICANYGCFIQYVDSEKILAQEPNLNQTIKFGMEVPDYVIDPAKLIVSCLQNIQQLGTSVICETEIISIERELNSWNLLTHSFGKATQIKTTGLVITAGSWSLNLLRSFFDIRVPAQYINGSMVVLSKRLLNHVISLCDMPSSGDSAIPCYNHTLLGSTWRPQDTFTPTHISDIEFDEIFQKVSTLLSNQMLNYVSHTYSGVRLILPETHSDLRFSDRLTRRGYYILDCKESYGLPELVAAFGGKMTLFQNIVTDTIRVLLKQMGINSNCPLDFSLSPYPYEIITNLASRDKNQLVTFAS